MKKPFIGRFKMSVAQLKTFLMLAEENGMTDLEEITLYHMVERCSRADIEKLITEADGVVSSN